MTAVGFGPRNLSRTRIQGLSSTDKVTLFETMMTTMDEANRDKKKVLD